MDPWLQYKDIFQDYGVFLQVATLSGYPTKRVTGESKETWWKEVVPDSEKLSIYP